MVKNIAIAVLATVAMVGGALFLRVPAPGAVSGPDIPFQYLKWGLGSGVEVAPVSAGLTDGSTTPCALLSPSATSSLESAGVSLSVASTAATTWTIARNTTPYATTTQIGTNFTVAAGAQATIEASSTLGNAAQAGVFPPNTYLVFSETGGITAGDAAGTGFVPSGSCHATFETYRQLY